MLGFLKNILMLAVGIVSMGLGAALLKFIGVLNLVGIALGVTSYFVYFKSRHEQSLAMAFSVGVMIVVNVGIFAIVVAQSK